jgi:hypothetical protein
MERTFSWAAAMCRRKEEQWRYDAWMRLVEDQPEPQYSSN